MHIDESKKFDKRTIERNLKEGIISAKEWEQFLKKLPDVSDKGEFVMSEDTQEKETAEDEKGTPREPVGEDRTPEKE